jgi:hypothetical protein
MKISQLLLQPLGTRINPGTLTIKTAKKKWQVKDVWWQQVILMDETGEMPADVKLGKYLPLDGKKLISIIVAEVQNAEYLGKNRKKLVVEQFTIPTQTVDEFQSKQDEMDKEVRLIVRSKIKCWQIAGYLSQPGITPHDAKFFAKSLELDEIVDAIIGE